MGWGSTRIELATSERLFAGLHRRFLTRGYREPPWERLDGSTLSSSQLELTANAWAERSVAEYRSMIVMGEVLARLPEIGMPLPVSTAASRLIADEARHTELCARVAEGLGARSAEPMRPQDLALSRGNLPAHLFVARWVGAMFCLGETASLGALTTIRQHTTDPCVGAVVATLLRDERLHDRFGWALARLVFPRLTDDEAEWLAADLVHAFVHYESMHVPSDCMKEDTSALASEDRVASMQPTRERSANLGIAPAEASADAFYRRVERVILPGLAKLGVPAYESWQLRLELRTAAT